MKISEKKNYIILVVSANWGSPYGISVEVLQKLGIVLPYVSAIPLLFTCPKDSISHNRYTFKFIFIVLPFATARE